jgi:lambda family phage tail tape measure protein
MPFAQGGAFSGGRVTPFARGGVVSGPVAFPMRGGAGLMGEAGPEAILPLQRGADGRLGVAAGGGGGARVTVNITTPDVEGFRRSRGQVAAQIARAVDRGRRDR